MKFWVLAGSLAVATTHGQTLLNRNLENEVLARVSAGEPPPPRTPDPGHDMAHCSGIELGQGIVAGSVHAERRTSMGMTALYAAAQDGHRPVIDALFQSGVPANGPQNVDGSTPLWAAANAGSLEACEALLGGGADPNDPAAGGETHLSTPLGIAVHNGQVAMIEWLVAAGADLHATDNGGDSVLVYSKSRDVTRLLTKLGARK